MLNLKEIEAEIRERILPHWGLEPGDLCGLMLYGSRVNGQARPDSDLDALAYVESAEKVDLEYHGGVGLWGRKTPIELRIQSAQKLEEELSSPVRVDALSKGRIILDVNQALARFQERARALVDELPEDLVRSFSGMEAAQLLGLIRISATETCRAARALCEKSPAAAQARFFEFLPDLHLYTALFLVLRSRARGIDARLPWSLYLAQSNRPARLLNLEKYEGQPWFKGLLTELNTAMHMRPATLDGFAWALETSFREATGEPLLLADAASEEVWVSA